MGLEPPVDNLQIRRTKERVGLCLDQVELYFLVRPFVPLLLVLKSSFPWIYSSRITLVSIALGRLFLRQKTQEQFPARLWSVPNSCG